MANPFSTPFHFCFCIYRKGDPLPSCPYGKKCTYGNKCKFYHPERGMGPHKSVTERLSEHAARHLSARNLECQSKTVVCGKSLSVPLSCSSTSNGTDAPLSSEQRRKPLGNPLSPAYYVITRSPAKLNLCVLIRFFALFSSYPIICARCMQYVGQH